MIPDTVTVAIEGQRVIVKGPKGERVFMLHPDIEIAVHGETVVLMPRRETKKIPALWGLNRKLIAGIIEGVTKGFEKKLELEGVGYRAQIEGSILVMQLGFTHPVRISAPEGITFKVEKNVISISGNDKMAVGEIAARIRAWRPPEPYKGKGIHYQGEIIRRKAGKKAVASA